MQLTTARPALPTRRLRAVGMVAALGLGMIAGQSLSGATASAQSAAEQVVALTNQVRAQNGLPPLSVKLPLIWAAQVHANEQAALNRLSHTGRYGDAGQRIAGQRATRRDYRWNAWGENVAMGARDAASVLTGWMNSPGHRANILNASYTDIGVGLAYSSNGTPYWTMVLARPG